MKKTVLTICLTLSITTVGFATNVKYSSRTEANILCKKYSGTNKNKCIDKKMGIPEGVRSVSYDRVGIPRNQHGEIVKVYTTRKKAFKICRKNIDFHSACVDNASGAPGSPFITREDMSNRNLSVTCKYTGTAKKHVVCNNNTFTVKRENDQNSSVLETIIKSQNGLINRMQMMLKKAGVQESKIPKNKFSTTISQ